MRSAEYIAQQLKTWMEEKKPLMWIAWNIALLCVGWAYVYAALGEYCTPANRKKYYNGHPSHTTIKTKCQVLNDEEKSNCKGCKWFPSGKRTRIFDCRGFTWWILYIVYGFKLVGGGCTSQWKTEKNWKAKGKIDTMPKDTMVCLFQYNPEKKNMAHTGFGFNNETVECQVGVQYSKKRSSKWTHWAIPACMSEDYVPPEEKPKEDKKPVNKTIRKGNKGDLVKQCQQLLKDRGYDLGICGVDGDFGVATEKAVKAFQKDHGLKVDGVVGESTWAALQTAEEYYTVTITHLTKAQADAVIKEYPNATKKKG